ncbi:MAG: hypothetical protein WAK94_14975 [Steroidobacteraceae bacterium]
MAKRNYRQVKRLKEEARKTRQMQKQQRRSDRTAPAGVTDATESPLSSEPIDPALPKP